MKTSECEARAKALALAAPRLGDVAGGLFEALDAPQREAGALACLERFRLFDTVAEDGSD